MGIMVWQDFMIACSEVPEDDMSFVQKITAEATFQVKRLRDHPCMSYWCGANEIRGAFDGKEELYTVLTTHYLFRGITSELCPDIPYERTTPYAFAFMQNDPCEGDCHNNLSEPCLFGASFKGFDDFEYEDKNEWAVMKRRIKNYENYLEETKSNFSSECAVLGMCNYESLIKFTPEEERTLDSKFLENRFLGNPYTFVMPTFFERQKKFAEGMYGKVSDLKDLVKKCNKAQLDIMRSEIVYSRINGRSTGFLNWMYNDIWPTGTWSVIDYYLSKKPAYYEMKRCFQPLMCEIIRIGQSYFLCLANDFDSPAPFTATVGTKSYDGKTLVSQTLQATVEGNGTHIERLTFPTDGDYIFAEGQFKDTPVSTSYELGRYREQDITPHYEVEIKKTDSHTFEAVIQAKTFVRCFRIIAKNAYIEDNYFDLTAGERKRVKIVSHEKNAEISDIQYDTFADIWND
jgi:beta-mannosidase